MRRFVLCCLTFGLLAAPAAAQTPRCDDLDPKVCLQPFPSNFFTKKSSSTDTGIQLDLPVTAMPRNVAGKPIDPTEWNRNDGFSPGSLITTYVPGLDLGRTGAAPITDAGASKSSRAPIMVLDAKTLKRHLVWAEMDFQASSDDVRNLIVRPAQNFREGRTYIVVLRNLRETDGDRIPAGEAFAGYRERARSDSRSAHMEWIFQRLKKAKVARDESLFLAWDFTVASERNLSERMRHMRDTSFAGLGDANLADMVVKGRPPSFTVDRVEENPSGEIARRVTGHFDVPCFLDTPGCEAGGSMRYLPGSTIPARIPGNSYRAKYVCNIPNSAKSSPSRASLYGHGLFGSTGEVSSGQLRTFANEENITFCATHWAGMSCEQLPPVDRPDNQGAWQQWLGRNAAGDRFNCDIPNVLTAIGDLSRFNTMIDRVQHGILAFLYLGRLMAHDGGFLGDPAFRFGGQPAFESGRVEYDGNSQGGIIGGALAALMVDGDRAVLGVPGMNYSTLLQRSTDFGRGTEDECPPARMDDLPSYACLVYKAYPNEADRQVVFGLMQILWDRGEGNGYAWHMTRDPLRNTPPHEILLHVAFGDHQVTTWAAAVEARTIGARIHDPVLDEGDRGADADARWFGAIPAIREYPYDGSAIIVWDSGPIRDGCARGTGAPLLEPLPPLDGCPSGTPSWQWGGHDPHSEPRSTRSARIQKSAFMRPGGSVVDVCGDAPCYSRNWK